MREELKGVFTAIQKEDLPSAFDHLLDDIWNATEGRFHVQESYILDFKETNPSGFSDGYGAGFVRLALGFHNSFGGVIIVGVKDRVLTVSGIDQPFDVESFNRVLTDFAAISIECVSKCYRVETPAGQKQIAVILVPRRKGISPIKLRKDLGKYKAGTLWVRDRHEVLEAETRHLPMLFSERTSLPNEDDGDAKFPVHRSFPPSPATLKEFISRGDLLTSLWGWFVFGENPRLYLHGPGGSGKSTLAFEFARLLAEHGHGVRASTGERLDYVIFISGKETELNPLSGTEQAFAMRQFATAREQFVQIIYHSGLLSVDEQTSADDNSVKLGLDELFSHFSGLIVIDDIDALSRRGLETGEEVLFLKAVLAKQRTRILYTLRHPPQHALTSSLKVPGLDYASEFHEFVDACCKQFGVSPPPAEISHQIADRTHSLPLLVETVIGLRRYCSNYSEALSLFNEKGGDDARRYLYQREYDRLDSYGKSRPILGALYLLEQPVSFKTLNSLFQFTPEQIRDAIGECASVFLSTSEDENGETLYQLAAPSVPFVKVVSQQLPHFDALDARVKHFNGQTNSSSEESAVITSLQVLIRNSDFEGMVKLCEGRLPNDVVMVNPRVQSLLGQAYAELGFDHKEKARACFREAEGMGYTDVFMMRRWYNMELQYNQPEAERICDEMIRRSGDNPRALSEFWSKKGACGFQKANSILSVSRDKAFQALRTSIVCYFEALWIATTARIDTAETARWAERPLFRLITLIGDELENIPLLIDELTQRRHDLSKEAAQLLIGNFRKIPARTVEASPKRFKGLCSRSSGVITRAFRKIDDFPAFKAVKEEMDYIQTAL